ncbi:MAG TPA: NADH:ubiquinone reductase (Na(+)-transporting) subunit B [Planctomycetaceae bacterium]|nr:NADH:ubiquinone reductase (Na(+)-transporting) subunit B [Planctomycetaceae bacterium]
MKWLRKVLDSQAPLFEEKGKLEKLYPLYEAADTFLYTPGETTRGPSHVRDALDLKRMMSIVVLALLPCVIMACYNTGYQASVGASSYIASTNAQVGGESYDSAIQSALGWRSLIAGLPSPDSFWGNLLLGATYFLPVYIVCMTAGGICEVLFSIIRKHEVNEGFLVTGLLFPLTLPPTIPLWQVAVGIIFGVVIGKEVFGGTGRNFLNPALTARAFLYFAYPAQSSGDKVWNAFGNVDGISGATILGNVAALPNKAEAVKYLQNFDYADYGFGFCMGSMGETSTLFCALGAFVLVLTGIGSWRIMLSVLLAGLATASVVHFSSGDSNAAMFAMTPIQHLLVGSFAFGLVFMATDPVSASMTDTGKYIYGGLIGFLVIMIRVINPAYPEGMMLAILVGNVFAPLIDYFVTQRNINRRLHRWAQNVQVEV